MEIQTVVNSPLLFCIDPGTYMSGYAYFDAQKLIVLDKGVIPNQELLARIRAGIPGFLVIEGFQCQGNAVGLTTFFACEMAGKLREAWENVTGIKSGRVFRSEEKMHLCGSMRAKDPNISQAIKDKFITLYGGTNKTITGTVKQPGPLHGIATHMWSALAVGITWWEYKRHRRDLIDELNQSVEGGVEDD